MSLEKMSQLLVFLVLAIVQNVQHLDAATTKHVKNEVLPIIFPGPTKGTLQYESNEVPEECKHLTYCTVKPKDYPEEKFNKMFKGVKPVPQPTLVLDSMLANRQGDPEERDDCDSEVTYGPIYTAREKRDKEWLTVIQAPEEGYVQKVRLETCTNPGGKCFNFLPPMTDITTLCKQKYNKWEVLVDDGKNGTVKKEVELPVCCSCQYKSSPIVSKFGVPEKTSPAIQTKSNKS